MREKINYHGQDLLPITSDIVFKRIFGSEDNKDLLMSLLNSFLDILCFDLFKDKEEYINSFRFSDRMCGSELTDMMEVNFIELNKVKNIKLDDMTDLWISFLNAKSEEELDMLSMEDERLKKAVEKLKYVSAD